MEADTENPPNVAPEPLEESLDESGQVELAGIASRYQGQGHVRALIECPDVIGE